MENPCYEEPNFEKGNIMIEELGRTIGNDPIIGQRGSFAHLHETGFGTGMLTVRKQGEPTFHLPVDNSVRDVNELLAQNPNFTISPV